MADSRDGQQAAYSFLVQSSASPVHDTAGSFDGHAHTKQKRRRTSPRDHAILEAAYQRNSKPDKEQRAEIVNQVELGEKEVQIWFQNRRQNDRRKSKPLQPHELLAHFRNGLSSSSPATANDTHTILDVAGTNRHDEVPVASTDFVRPSSRSSGIQQLLNPSSSLESLDNKDDNHLSLSQRTDPHSTPPSSYDDCQQDRPALVNQQPKSLHGRKRSHDLMHGNSDVVPSTETNSVVPPPLKKTSSFVRLAMTVDGAVKVRTNNDPTPSPPKQRQSPLPAPGQRETHIRRSQSAVEGGLNFRDINPPIRQIGEGFGRSRDARTWEFYCDRDSGEALSTQAEAERNGSAIGAINLIRSQSHRSKSSVLSPNRVKQNSRRTTLDRVSGKPKLTRVRSSMARLQSFDAESDPDGNKTKRAKHARSSSGDSDKENWAPGTRSSQNVLRRMHPSVPRSTILQEDHPILAPATSMSKTADTDPGERVPSRKAKGDDLDCIQGLLSLSQGAWR